ncbi:MAG TPA: hypothetical protein VEH84_00370 [Alphaproteobacteria bacterium]|nr:hypothetical protein [Alphaproteobacteria bacterium]
MTILRILAVALTAVLALGACGKRGELKPPPGAASDFPRAYPPPQPDPAPSQKP